MARDFFINGESMVAVKGRQGSTLASLVNLGLSDGPIPVSMVFRDSDMNVDAWGGNQGPPVDIQVMLAEVQIRMTLIHFDRDVLDAIILESMGGAATIGTLARAGARMGNGAALFAPTNHYVSLNIYSPVASKPWRFFYSKLYQNPLEFPLGVEKSIITLNWRCIPYTPDPWQAGQGAGGWPLWDHTLDS